MKSYSKYPVLILWNYGYWCNMNCLHCYSRAEAKLTHHDMSTEEAWQIRDQIVKAQPLHVHFGGGEPLGRKDFFPIASSLAEQDIGVTLSTNASLLGDEEAQKLAKLPAKTVAVSIYGAKPSTHDAFTRFPGAFFRLVSAVNYLKKYQVQTKFVVNLNALTAPEALEIIKLAVNLGIDSVQFQTLRLTGNALDNASVLGMNMKEWIVTYKRIITQSKRYHQLSIDLGVDNDPVLAKQLGTPVKKCPCGIYSLTIKPNGDVTVCPLVTKAIGNVLQEDLLDLWRNSPDLTTLRENETSPCWSLPTIMK